MNQIKVCLIGSIHSLYLIILIIQNLYAMNVTNSLSKNLNNVEITELRSLNNINFNISDDFNYENTKLRNNSNFSYVQPYVNSNFSPSTSNISKNNFSLINQKLNLKSENKFKMTENDESKTRFLNQKNDFKPLINFADKDIKKKKIPDKEKSSLVLKIENLKNKNNQTLLFAKGIVNTSKKKDFGFDLLDNDLILITNYNTNFTIPCTFKSSLSSLKNTTYIVRLYQLKNDKFNKIIKEKLTPKNWSFCEKTGFKVFYNDSDPLFTINSVSSLQCEIKFIEKPSNISVKNIESQKFTLIYVKNTERSELEKQISPTYYRLLSSNQTLVKVELNDTIKLDCYAITSKKSISKGGFLWRKSSKNKKWDYNRYRDNKKSYNAEENAEDMADQNIPDEFKIVKSELIISNIELEDSGYHYCDYDSDSVRKYHGIFVEVLPQGDHYKGNITQLNFVEFESEHSTEYPLVVKSKETFYIHIKLTFNEVCNATASWYYKMNRLIAEQPIQSESVGFSMNIFYKLEATEMKNSGDYTVIIYKHDETLNDEERLNVYEQSINFNKLKFKNETITLSSNQNKLKNINKIESDFNDLDSYVKAFKTILVKVEGPVELNVYKSDKFYLNNYYSLVCHAFSSVPTKLYWKWSYCKMNTDCAYNASNWHIVRNHNLDWNPTNFQDLSKEVRSGNNETMSKFIWTHYEQVNILDLKYQNEITYACISESFLGRSNVTFHMQPSEVDLSIFASINKVFTNDNLTLTCEGIFHQKPTLQWLYQSNINSSSTLLTEKNTKNYFIVNKLKISQIDEFKKQIIYNYDEFIRYKYYYLILSKLIIQGVNSDQNGYYHCKNEINNKESALHKLVVENLVVAKILNFTRIDLKYKVIFVCKYEGNPEPIVRWYKDGVLWNATTINDYFESKLVLDLETDLHDDNYYGCEVENRLGKDRKNLLFELKDLKKRNSENSDDNLNKNNTRGFFFKLISNFVSGLYDLFKQNIFITGIFIFLIIFFIIMSIYFKLKKKRGLQRGGFQQAKKCKQNFGFAFYNEVQNEDLIDFGSINRKSNNFFMQTVYKSLEFPLERLELGRVIGQGAYGVVVKAEAIGIEKSIKITTVAVKMLRDDRDEEQRRSLISEIQKLMFLGKHLNIVNLLGIVTKNNQLMAIMEYCRYGNVKNFLLANRQSYINMVNIQTGEFEMDYSKIKPEASNSSRDSGFCVKTPLKTLDLVNFSFQISKGMQYVHSKKLLHRDLAARNVLLKDDFVVKICDFGLSKDVYMNDMYVNKGYGKLPIKWMAIESILDQMFTKKSDVWSFAVVCWELFTLGANPYPSIQIDEDFHKKIQSGYRMERPEYCPLKVYEIMSKCWDLDPAARPAFDQLCSYFYNLLDQYTQNAYIDINSQKPLTNLVDEN